MKDTSFVHPLKFTEITEKREEEKSNREKIKELEVYFRLRLKNKRGGDHENFRIIMANVLTIDHGIESIKSVG